MRLEQSKHAYVHMCVYVCEAKTKRWRERIWGREKGVNENQSVIKRKRPTALSKFHCCVCTIRGEAPSRITLVQDIKVNIYTVFDPLYHCIVT